MKFLLAMLILSSPAFAGQLTYDPDKYYIDYLTATEKDKSLIVYEVIKTGQVIKFLVPTKDLSNPEAIRAIKVKVMEEDRE